MDANQSKGREEPDHTMSDRPAVPDDADAIDRDPYIVPEPEDDQQVEPQHFPGDEPVDRMLADEAEDPTPDRT